MDQASTGRSGSGRGLIKKGGACMDGLILAEQRTRGPTNRRQRPSRGKPNPRNEILETAGRGKHFARRLLFPPYPSRAGARASLSNRSTLPGSAPSPLHQSSPLPSSRPLTSPVQIRRRRRPPPRAQRGSRRPSPAARFAPSFGAWTPRIRRYRSQFLQKCVLFAICLFFFSFSKAIYRGF